MRKRDEMSTETTTESGRQRQDTAVPLPARLLTDIRGLIDEARQNLARSVNSGLVLLYWNIGRRVREDILKGTRATYGDEIVSALGRHLTAEFGRGFGRRNLFRMIRFAEVFPNFEIVSSLMTQLSWTHFLHIIVLDDPLQRDFYAEMCRLERWSTRTLEKKIRSMLYERTALAKKPDAVIRRELDALCTEDQLTPDLVFKDPYLLDFLGLNDRYVERDIEDQPAPYYVFSPTGAWLGELTLPPHRVACHQIGNDFVLGVWVDELDVQYVRMYALEKG
jgi:hypothetical protein